MTPERLEEIREASRKFQTRLAFENLQHELLAHIDALTAERDEALAAIDYEGAKAISKQAQSVIDEKNARITELEAALRPFAHLAACYDAEPNWLPDACPVAAYPALYQSDEKRPTVGSLRVARAALEKPHA